MQAHNTSKRVKVNLNLSKYDSTLEHLSIMEQTKINGGRIIQVLQSIRNLGH